MEPPDSSEYSVSESVNAALVDKHKSPFENVADHELQARVEDELRKVSEPYRTAVVLRDIEDLSYEEIAEITQVSLGTVKSRITRGRDALRKRLTEYAKEVGPEMGLDVARLSLARETSTPSFRGKRIEVTP
jgi:DNA-directed RNA polymerase specialized sigma24 family protein